MKKVNFISTLNLKKQPKKKASAFRATPPKNSRRTRPSRNEGTSSK